MAINHSHNYEKIPELAADIPEFILVTYLDNKQLDEHIHFRHEQQMKMSADFLISHTRDDAEFEAVCEASKNWQIGIAEEARRRKASRLGHPTMKVVTNPDII